MSLILPSGLCAATGYCVPPINDCCGLRQSITPATCVVTVFGDTTRVAAAVRLGTSSEDCHIAIPETESVGIFTPRPASHSRWHELKSAAEQIAALHGKHGGSTFGLQSGPVCQKEGFVVSLTRNPVFPGRYIPSTAILSYVHQNPSLLDSSDLFVGTWYDRTSSKSHLDISLLVWNAFDALLIAVCFGQEAVYDLAFGSIPTKVLARRFFVQTGSILLPCSAQSRSGGTATSATRQPIKARIEAIASLNLSVKAAD